MNRKDTIRTLRETAGDLEAAGDRGGARRAREEVARLERAENLEHTAGALRKMSEPRRGMLVDVFRTDGPDCSNGGISSRASRLLLVGDGVAEVFVDDGVTPVVRLVRREIGGRLYCHVKPDGEERHTMAGGNFVYSCDSRFRDLCPYPIPVHDRIER